MNVFQWLELHGDDADFVPIGPPTDGPATPEMFAHLSDVPSFPNRRMHGEFLSLRVVQLMGRVERGEEIFHPDEAPPVTGLTGEPLPNYLNGVFGLTINGTMRAGRDAGE